MRVLGMGWDEFRTTWSETVGGRRREKSVNELVARLMDIIKAEKKMKIPDEPKMTVLARPNLPVYGRSTKQREDGLAKDTINEEKFWKDTKRIRCKREAKGEGSLFSELQPFYRPELSELKGRRIDVLVSFVLDKKEKKGIKKKIDLRWCQGEVVNEIKTRAKPMVMVKWDKLSDVDGKAGAAVKGE